VWHREKERQLQGDLREEQGTGAGWGGSKGSGTEGCRWEKGSSGSSSSSSSREGGYRRAEGGEQEQVQGGLKEEQGRMGARV
jgi:hypothetical protein